MHLVRSKPGDEQQPGRARNCVYVALTRLMAIPGTLQEDASRDHGGNSRKKGWSGHSKLRRNARSEFLRSTRAPGKEEFICDPETLPSLESAYLRFLDMFPGFVDTSGVDQMRGDEYAHLTRRVCLDYSGFGLFSHLQRVCDPASSSFRLAYVSANLPTHALYGIAEESSLEGYIRRRIMEYFRLSESEYCMVFTASKGSAVRLLAESYRFDTSGRLITAYDHQSESIEWMMGCAREKGARVSTGFFRWPSLRICSKDLKKQLTERKARRDSSKGLFVFPLQSRVTGVKYSYQWIPLAQQNQWHVLLDASALGPRDMDALGVSVFSPDFIVSSFYKVFGSDPSGFGCLFIRKSSISCLCNSSRARAVGMVKLLPCSPGGGAPPPPDDEIQRVRGEATGEEAGEFNNNKNHNCEMDPSNVSSFSGPLSMEFETRDKSIDDLFVASSSLGTRDAFDRIIQASTSGAGNAGEASGESSVTANGGSATITVLYPGGDQGVSRVSDVKGKRRVEEFEIGESSRQKQHEIEEIPPEPEIEELQTGAKQPEAEEHKVYTLAELLSFPQSEPSQSLKSEELLVQCKALDQTKLLGMSKIRNRLRYLITWLGISLIKLRHPTSDNTPLVRIFGPSRKYDRGAALAFNLYAWDGVLLQPTLVQKLADRNSISLGLAVIKNVEAAALDVGGPGSFSSSGAGAGAGGRKSNASVGSCCNSEFVAVTIALSYVSNFEDVYRLWEFIARFLDADFVNKEVWRYHSLNQEIVVLR